MRGRPHLHLPSLNLRVYFARAWWSLALTGVLLAATTGLAVWWAVGGDDAPGYVEPLTVICGVALTVLELTRPGQKHQPPAERPAPQEQRIAVNTRTFGRARETSAHELEDAAIPAAKVWGDPRGRAHAFRPASVVNVGGPELDLLPGVAVEVLNRSAALAGCLHNTGGHGLTLPHRSGGTLIFQIGPAYVDCSDDRDRFDLTRLKDLVEGAPVQALEVSLRNSAPAKAAQPGRHAEFSDTDSLLDWVELLAQETGLPVGLRSRVGDMAFWYELTQLMSSTGRGVDFVTVTVTDGTESQNTSPGEHPFLGLPLPLGLARVYATFARSGLNEQVAFVGSGGIDQLDLAVTLFALGCDSVEIGPGLLRLATEERGAPKDGDRASGSWRRRDNVAERSAAVVHAIRDLRRGLLTTAQAAGVEHPGLLDTYSVEMVSVVLSAPLGDAYGYEPGWGLPSPADRAEIAQLMAQQLDR